MLSCAAVGREGYISAASAHPPYPNDAAVRINAHTHMQYTCVQPQCTCSCAAVYSHVRGCTASMHVQLHCSTQPRARLYSLNARAAALQYTASSVPISSFTASSLHNDAAVRIREHTHMQYSPMHVQLPLHHSHIPSAAHLSEASAPPPSHMTQLSAAVMHQQGCRWPMASPRQHQQTAAHTPPAMHCIAIQDITLYASLDQRWEPQLGGNGRLIEAR
jgi:hypothetical protein